MRRTNVSERPPIATGRVGLQRTAPPHASPRHRATRLTPLQSNCLLQPVPAPRAPIGLERTYAGRGVGGCAGPQAASEPRAHRPGPPSESGRRVGWGPGAFAVSDCVSVRGQHGARCHSAAGRHASAALRLGSASRRTQRRTGRPRHGTATPAWVGGGVGSCEVGDRLAARRTRHRRQSPAHRPRVRLRLLARIAGARWNTARPAVVANLPRACVSPYQAIKHGAHEAPPGIGRRTGNGEGVGRIARRVRVSHAIFTIMVTLPT